MYMFLINHLKEKTRQRKTRSPSKGLKAQVHSPNVSETLLCFPGKPEGGQNFRAMPSEFFHFWVLGLGHHARALCKNKRP